MSKSFSWENETRGRGLNQTSLPMTMPNASLMLTSAISTNGPTDKDTKRNAELNDCFQSFGLLETETQMAHRKEVLSKISNLLINWVKEIGTSKNLPSKIIETYGGKLYAFGSYRLGIHDKGADIDVLCVAPRHVERSDFFSSFSALLRRQGEVKELRVVENAFVPVIKLVFSGIELDLLFARLSLEIIPPNLDLRDSSLLKNLDGRCVRSLNGCRVTEEISRLVPNFENFKFALQVIKLWAKKRGVYSNVLGYLGGVSWAILLARICQLYPNAIASTLVSKFFFVYSQWKWPCPLLIRRPEECDLGLQVWDPRVNSGDRFHLMPIITPSYPQQNSTFNVNVSSKNVIISEINRGFAVTTDIAEGKAPWSKLLEPITFFRQFNYFMVVVINASSQIDQVEFGGFVESKIRFLTSDLDRNPLIDLARVNPEKFSTSNTTPGRFSSQFFIGLQFAKVQNVNVDLTRVIANFIQSVLAKAVSVTVFKPGMEVEVKYVKRKQLSNYLPKTVLIQHKKLDRKNINLSYVGSTPPSSSQRSSSPSLSPAEYNSSQMAAKRKREAECQQNKKQKTSAFDWLQVMPTQ